MTKKALLLIDIQNDFLPGGSLAINKGNEILPIINQLLSLPFEFVIATKDWHPQEHLSFAVNHKKNPGEKIILENHIEQILWPVHCVQNTIGAEFPPLLNPKKITAIFSKGTNKTIDSYSAFFDNGHYQSTGLDHYLKKHQIHKLFIAGLATDYCVKYSVLDALNLNFKVFVITDACQGVNLSPHDSEKALQTMKEAGATLITFKELKQFL